MTLQAMSQLCALSFAKKDILSVIEMYRQLRLAQEQAYDPLNREYSSGKASPYFSHSAETS